MKKNTHGKRIVSKGSRAQINAQKILQVKAENRRQFLLTLKPKVRKFAAQEFAKLGLFQ